MTKCSAQTMNLGKSPNSIKGLKCLGECKGSQTCSSLCFNKYGNPQLDEFLACALEEKKCMPMPASVSPTSSSGLDYYKSPDFFENSMLQGKWHKTFGISDIYDMFDCQVGCA